MRTTVNSDFIVKSDYEKIQVTFNKLCDQITDEEFSKLYLSLRKLCKENNIRFEIYYERSYYQSMVQVCNEWIESYVQKLEFEMAAKMRDTKNNHLTMIREIDIFFGANEAPAFIIDQYGYVRCFLDFKTHQKLILTVLSLA